MALSYDVDPKDPRTWVNSPAPPIPERYVSELAAMGGTHNGVPNLRFAWGQGRRRFYAGEMRILYTDDRIEPIVTHTPDSFAVKEIATGALTPCASYSEMVNYPESTHERVWTRGTSTAEFIGQPLWFVEQWKPAELLDTPANWERNRWGEWEDPATGRHYHHFDLLGPYPSEGRFDAFFVVGEPTGEKDPWGGQAMRYRPIGQDVLESVRRRLHAREHTKLESTEQRVRDAWREQEAKEKKQYDALADRIRQELLPHKHRFLEFGSRVSVPETFTGRKKSVGSKTR